MQSAIGNNLGKWGEGYGIEANRFKEQSGRKSCAYEP